MGCCETYNICQTKNSSQYQYTGEKITLPENKLSENVITINLSPVDNRGEFSFVTNTTELFSNVVNKFYEICPDCKSKNCIFSYEGNIMNQNLTMEQNGCKAGNINIIVSFDIK